MTSSPPPSLTGGSSAGKSITVALAQQGGSNAFRLTFGDDSLMLLDSGSLNRWSAAGIVERHQVAVSEQGVTVDGRLVRYADAHGPEELARILNRSQAHPTAQARAKGVPAPPIAPTARASDDDFVKGLTQRLRVTRDGFEFHVVYQTRFGQTRTEKLEAALESFQNMRIFRPHISMQKSGIRLVVTRWDGESFVEEPGIENLEHATPEAVEQLIKSKLLGSSTAAAAASVLSRPAVVRLEVVKRAQDNRFHLRVHRHDGKMEEGPLLIRPNVAKLALEGWFRPDVSLSMTAMNDRVVIEQNGLSTPGRRSETLPLITVEDAQRLEAVLNTCLKPPVDMGVTHPPTPPPPPIISAPEEGPTTSLSTELAVPSDSEESSPSLASLVETSLVDSIPAAAESRPPATQPAPLEPGHPPAAFLLKEWVQDLGASTAAMDPGTLNAEVFAALRDWFERPVSSNEYGFPAFSIEFPGVAGARESLELVLTPHYLLCSFGFGYARFGSETRLFLTRLDDYIAFHGHALRGAIEWPPLGSVRFLVSAEFIEFLNSQSDRNYKIHFSDALVGMHAIVDGGELIWPLSREERLFQMAAATAKSYSLPVSQHSVVLDPNAEVFIGFKRATPEGMEFRDGDEYARFCPVEVEVSEEGQIHRFIRSSVLLGWALDSDGHVCAIYRQASGFIPPETKLLRFLTETEAQAEKDLTQLAWLPPENAAAA